MTTYKLALAATAHRRTPLCAWAVLALVALALPGAQRAQAEHIPLRPPISRTSGHTAGRGHAADSRAADSHATQTHVPMSAGKAVAMPVERGRRGQAMSSARTERHARAGLRSVRQTLPTVPETKPHRGTARSPLKGSSKNGAESKRLESKRSGAKGRRHHPHVQEINDPVELKQARVVAPQPTAMASAQTDDPAADYLASIQAQDARRRSGNLVPTVPAAATQAGMQQPWLQALRPASRDELTEAATQPVLLPGLYRNGRLVVPAPLKGSHEILVHQNMMANEAGLERIQDDDDLRRLRAAHLLVDFPVSVSLRLNPELNEDRRCARPWSVRFATDIAHGFYARFGQPLQVNSAVRTVAYQLRLQRVNGNAAAVDGDGASPHLTGQALDFGKRGMSVAQIAWMRAYLKPLMDTGKIDVEEEFQQACFHISVYRNYMSAGRRHATQNDLAQLQENAK